jgi:hypothetical protein
VLQMVKRAVTSRLAGDKPSPVKAALVAVVVGTAAAVVTYQVLRS